jgi:hypothetical protein
MNFVDHPIMVHPPLFQIPDKSMEACILKFLINLQSVLQELANLNKAVGRIQGTHFLPKQIRKFRRLFYQMEHAINNPDQLTRSEALIRSFIERFRVIIIIRPPIILQIEFHELP